MQLVHTDEALIADVPARQVVQTLLPLKACFPAGQAAQEDVPMDDAK